MKLTVLGSGTSVPHPQRSSAGFWLETSGGSVLLDCSASSIHRMAQEGLDWANLDAVWISHFHLDHIGGLAPLLFGLKYAPETQSRTKPLTIFGPKGLTDVLSHFDRAADYGLTEQPFPFAIKEVEPLDQFEILPGVEAATAKTFHTPESLALHVRDTDGATLVYTSDTGFHQPLAAFARRVDLFLLECSFVEKTPVETHLMLAEAMFLVGKAEPKAAMFNHFYPEWDEVVFTDEVAKFSPRCEVIEAADGRVIMI